MYDLIIIGGGPAGVAAGVYAARKKLKTLLVTESIGGQSLVSDSIENWIGEVSISGFELAQKLEKHLRAQKDIEIKMPEKAILVKEIQDGFEVGTDKNDRYQARALVVASGGRRRRLGVPGEDKFEGRGVSYCSTCDAPLFKGKTVVVIGGGNAGLEGAVDLAVYAKKIYLLTRDPDLHGDQITQEEVGSLGELVTIITEAEIKRILGKDNVTGLEYQDTKTAKIYTLEVDGVFVEIGSVPNTEFLRGLVELNEYGEVIVDHQTGATSRPGIIAAGDVTDEFYKQNNIAVGNGVAAALTAYNYILNLKKKSPAAG